MSHFSHISHTFLTPLSHFLRISLRISLTAFCSQAGRALRSTAVLIFNLLGNPLQSSGTVADSMMKMYRELLEDARLRGRPLDAVAVPRQPEGPRARARPRWRGGPAVKSISKLSLLVIHGAVLRACVCTSLSVCLQAYPHPRRVLRLAEHQTPGTGREGHGSCGTPTHRNPAAGLFLVLPIMIALSTQWL